MFSAIEFVQFAFSLISLPLYLLFLATLIRFRNKSPFNSDFFELCFNLGVIDVLTSANRWVTATFVNWGWFGLPYLVEKWSILAKIGVMTSWVGGLAQLFGVFALALNRFTGIVMPLRHELVWTKSFLHSFMVLQWLLPALVTSPQAFLSFAYKRDNTTGRLSSGAYWLDPDAQKYYFLGAFVFNLSINIITLILYSITLYTVRKNIQENQDPTTARHDITLAIYGFSVFVVMFLFGIFTFARATKPNSELLKQFYVTCADLVSWCNPWLCLILLAKVRKHMIATLFCRQVEENTVNVIVIPLQNFGVQLVQPTGQLVPRAARY